MRTAASPGVSRTLTHRPPVNDGMHTYLSVVVVTAGPGALMVATMITGRFTRISRLPLNTTYTLVTVAVVALGMATVGVRSVWRESGVLVQVASVLVGVGLGHVVVLSDGLITDAFRQRSRSRSTARTGSPSAAVRRPAVATSYAQVRPSGVGRALTVQRRQSAPRVPAVATSSQSPRPRMALGWLLAVAVAEELLYRGVLTAMALDLPLAASLVALVCCTTVFAMVHISFGWSQVVAKLPLAVLTLASALLLGSPVCAIVTHGYFNWHYWRKKKFTALSAAATPWSA